MTQYLLGFDLGTQGSKGVIVDLKGREIAAYDRPHVISHPRPGWAEQDAYDVWWRGFTEVCHGLLARSGIDPGDIAAVGCSTITPCMLPLDKAGKPLRSGIMYGIDTRSGIELDEINAMIEKRFAGRETRPFMSQQSVGCRVLWYRKNEPELFDRTARYMGAITWLVYLLTGKYTVSVNEAGGFAPFFDAESGCWDEEMCSELGIRSAQLPTVVPAHHVVGGVSESAAASTGLKAGTPVIAGLGDSVAEQLSTGACEGDTVLLYGSTMIISKFMPTPPLHSRWRSPLPITGLYNVGGGATATSASITRWFRDRFCYEELLAEKETSVNAYTALSDMASAVPPGSEGLILLPYFAGERSPMPDSRAKGVFFGLGLHHTKAHMYRAILEGIAFSLRHIVESMREDGIVVESFLSAGGGIKSPVWVQIMSDVTGLPQRCLPGISGAPTGNAYLAGYGIGLFDDMQTLRSEWITDSVCVKPDMANHARYQPYYEVYRELYRSTKELMWRLSDI